MFRTIFFSLFLLVQYASAALVELTIEEFEEGVEAGRFHVLADVRTSREFERGHIPSSTLVESLASFGNDAQVSTPADLAGCEDCAIAVYDSNGARASIAVNFLMEAGFNELYVFEGGYDEWRQRNRFAVETGTGSMAPPCTEGEATCSASGPVTPTMSPTYGRINDSRRLSAGELQRMKDNGEIGIIMDVREDFSGGHISGAILVGPLSFDNVEQKLAEFSPCFRCSVVVYGEMAANAIVILRSYGFASRLYEGPSVQEWEDTENSLVTEESSSPVCLSDTAAQFACEQQWLAFQNMPFMSPVDSPMALPTSNPVSEPTNSSSNAGGPAAIDSVVSSGADRWNAALGIVLVSTWLCAYIL